MKLALALIVKPTDDEAIVLDRCLKYTSPYVDGIFITITGENKACYEVAKKYNAVISNFEWVNDFAKARNFNFRQVPKEFDYILWLDADDVLRGVEKLKPTIEKNLSDVYSLNYLYAFDENNNPTVVHLKTQIVKNDGCVEWKGALHEDFKANRNLSTYFIKGIDRLHLSNEERFANAKARNLEVAKSQLEVNSEDPRSYWNVANSQSAMGKSKEALENFNKFLKLSDSDDEKYIARLRMAENNWVLGNREDALDQARYAIGLKPEYPDAYYLLGKLLAETGQLLRAAESYIQGLVKKPPQLSILVYNPREYDYNPMLELSKIYIRLERPDMALPLLKGCYKIVKSDNIKIAIAEAEFKNKQFQKVIKIIKKLEKIKDKELLKKEFEKIPDEFKALPSVCLIRNRNFIKESCEDNEITIYCGFTARRWDARTIAEGIGGSEEAVINLTQRLAKKGWKVTVYNNCGHQETDCDGVTYKPHWTWNYRDKQNIVILWRSPMAADYEINAKEIYVDLHDVIAPGEFNDKRLARIDKVFFKSHFHRSLFPHIPDNQTVIIPNGIISSEFDTAEEKDQKLIVNTSSPDRSLSALCDVFEIVKKEIPDAKCKWAYGWGVFETVHSHNVKKMTWKTELEKRCQDLGIEMLGMISHQAIRDLYLKANLFVYPTEFAEIDCISLTKAMAGGALPITTDFSALGEKKDGGGEFIHSEKTKDTWNKPFQYDFSLEDEDKKQEIANLIIKYLKEPVGDRKSMINWAKTNYDWDLIVSKWEKILCH